MSSSVPSPIRPMKILLTTHVFLPEFYGGTETLVLGVALALQQRGHSVLVVTGFPVEGELGAGDRFDEYEVESIPVLRFRHARDAAAGNVMRDDYDNPLFADKFRQVLQEFAPDVVHFHHLERLSIKAIDACRDSAIPAFLTATDFWYICPTHALLLPDGRICDGPVAGGANCLKHLTTLSQPRWLAGIINHGVPNAALGVALSVLKRSGGNWSGRIGDAQALARRGATIAQRLPLLEKIFVPTRHAQRTLESNGIEDARFRVLPFGIKDHGYLKRVRQRGDGALVLGFIGSILPHKGLHVLLEALALVSRELPVTLKVYGSFSGGDEAYGSSLRQRAAGDPRVAFCGTFANAQLPAVLDGIDALVIPSLWHENMPLVSLSAQAAGCPVLASDIGGLADIVAHRQTGLLFAPGSAAELARLIGQLEAEPGLLHDLSAAAVTPRTIEQYVDVLEAEYRGVLQE